MEVKININTNQYDENGKLDTIALDTCGNLHKKNEDIYIVYKENEDGVETTNTIKISKNEVHIKKFGTINTNMSFKEGKIDLVKYRTTQGMFIIENHTNYLKTEINEDDSINIQIIYDIKVMDLFQGRNEVNISIRCK